MQGLPILVVGQCTNADKPLSEILLKKGYAPQIAATDRKAVKIISQQKIDLVIINFSIGRSLALDLIHSIKGLSPETEIIALTDHNSFPSGNNVLNLGIFAYFQKPFDIEQLLLSIKQVNHLKNTIHAKNQSDHCFDLLFNKSENPILIIDHNGNYLHGNKAACDFLECTFDDLITSTINDFMPSDSSNEKTIKYHQELWKIGRTVETKYLINNFIKTLSLVITPGKWKGQEVIYGLGIDKTTDKELEKQVSEQTNFIQLILDSLPIGIAVNTVEPYVAFKYMNENFPKFYGTTKEKISGSNSFWDAVYEDEEFRELIKTQVLGDCASNDPDRMIWTDIPITRQGEVKRIITARNVPLFNNNLMLSTVWDITDQKTTEAALYESEQKFKWLYVNAPIPYHILSAQGIITDVNQRWCDVLGYSKDEVIGKEIFEFIIPEERKSAEISFIKKKTSQQSFIEGSERKYQTKEGLIRVFRTYDYFVTDENQNIQFVQTTIEDITRQKQAEEKQQRNLNRMRSLVNILQYPAESNDDFLNYALDEAIKLTQSQIGFVSFYDKDKQQFNTNFWSSNFSQFIKSTEEMNIHHLENSHIWEEIKSNRKVMIVNSVIDSQSSKQTFPGNHAHLTRFLTAPIFIDGEMEAVVGVANKETDYDEVDALQLSLLMESVWKVIDRRKALTALSNSEAKQRDLINATKDIVLLKDENFKILMANKAAQEYYMLTEKEIIGKTDFDLLPIDFAHVCRKSDQQALSQNHLVVNIERIGDRNYETRKFPVPLDNHMGLGAFIRDITLQINSEASIKLQSTALNATANAIVITDPLGTIEWINPAFTSLTGYTFEESFNRNPRELVKSGLQDKSVYQQLWETISTGNVWKGRLVNHRKDGSLYSEEMTITPLLNEKREILHYIAIKEDVTESEQRERELSVVANVSAALRKAHNRVEMLPVILDQLIEQLNVDAATLVIHNSFSDEMVIELGRGLWSSSTGLHIPSGKGLSNQILATGQPYLNNNNNDPKVCFKSIFSNCQSTAAVPLVVQDQNIGVLFIGSNRKLGERDIRLLTSISDIAANALYRSSLHEQTQQKVDQLNSLRIIDQSINTSMDLRVTLNVILKQTRELLRCDALVVLLNKPHTMILDHAANLGFLSKKVENTHIQIDTGLTGQSILSRQIMSEQIAPNFSYPSAEKALLEGEGFLSYHSAPLIVKGDVKGVLISFYRKAFTPHPDWKEIFQTLATQTAIAINNHELFDRLQRSTTNLIIAYNETIEGWANALELRDKETKGHSQRVTNLTIKLAQAMNIADEDIGHIMRGAMLHDIGKMGIPDSILRKPGKLTDEEWVIVRKHPKDAYDLLSSIKYLQPAIDIPYCHHERWDGTGYPRGLKGEQIPLSARIFAVVDVWDAITSDRPYRKAWSPEKAKEHIRCQAGKHFDPKVVDYFLKIINDFPISPNLA